MTRLLGPVSEEIPFMATNFVKPVFPGSEDDVIAQLGAGIAIVSMIGSTFIIISYINFPRLRYFAFELILMVAIADFLRAFSYILTPRLDPSFCRPQALLMTFSELASILWVGSIAFTIHRIFLKEDFSIENTHHLKYHFFCWGVSLVATVLPLITHDYDTENPLWCWIKFDKDRKYGIMWGLVCYYVPCWVVLFYLAHVYIKVWRILKARPIVRNRNSPKNPKHHLVTQTRMAVYPTIFFFTIICCSIDRLYQWAHEGDRNYYLAVLDVVTINLQGFINSLVYGCTSAVRMEWMACFCPKLTNNGASDHYVCFDEEKRETSITRNTGLTTATESTYLRCSMNSDGQPVDSYNSPHTLTQPFVSEYN